jgi:AraC-like DNA-binding protein
MTTGDITVVPAGRQARFRWSGLNREFLQARICKRWLSHQFAAEPADHTIQNALELILHRNDPFVLQVGLAVADELRTPPSMHGQLAIQSAAQLLGTHLLRRYRRHPLAKSTRQRGGLASWQVRRVKAAMDDIKTNFSLTELAAMVGISPAHFCIAFRESTGLPPHRWQMQQRVDRAKELLSDPKLSLTEIATACGYASSSHFTNRFRQATGMTPSAYRRTL